MSSAVVIGAGIIGIACARELALAGLSVEMIHEGPLAGGATAAGMGHLVALDDRDPVARFTLRSLDLWAKMDLPEDCETLDCGCLWVAADDEEFEEARAKHARYTERGVDTQLCSAGEIQRLEPELAPGLAGGLWIPSDRVLYPPRAAAFFWKEAAAAGCRRRSGRATAVSPHRVELEDGSKVEADWVVVATGDRLTDLVPSIPVVPRKGHLLITSRGSEFIRRQIVELGYVKKAHSREVESVACNVQPRATGQVLVGSSRQLDTRDPAIEPRVLADMLARAGGYLPRLRDLEALRAWTGFRATTPDGVAAIGVLEPGLAVAGGHEGVGITQAPATAELLCASVLGRSSRYDAGTFDPRRFMEAA